MHDDSKNSTSDRESALQEKLRRAEREISRLATIDSHLRSAMESAKGFVLYRLAKDPEAAYGSRVVFASPSIREILGVENPSDFSQWFDCVHPEDRAAVKEEERAAAPRSKPFDKTMRVLDRNGVRWVRAVSYPVTASDGRISHYDGLIIDVTAVKEAERMAQESERRLQHMFDHAPVPLLEVDVVHAAAMFERMDQDDGAHGPVARRLDALARLMTVRAANRAAFALFGSPDTDDLARQLTGGPSSTSRQLFVDALPALARDGHFEGECSYQSRAGEPLDTIVSISAPGNPPDLSRVLVSYLDVTERRRAVEALRLRDRAVESSSNAVVIAEVTDSEWPIVYVNPAFERLTGYTEADVEATDGRLLFRGGPDQHECRILDEAWRQTREADAVVRGYRKHGGSYWAHVYTTPVRDESGATTHYVSIMNDVTRTKQFEEDLKYHAYHDALTGLPNRSLLQDRIEHAIVGARRGGGPVSVAFVDLDNFKNFNDTLGHDFGDRVLMAMAERLKNCVRQGDTVARYGGDEFVLVVHTAAETAGPSPILQRAIDSIARSLKVDDQTVRLTCSIGYAMFPRHGEDPVTLLRNADVAMYEAKARGRNQVAAYSASTGLRLRERVSLEASLRLAVERDDIYVQYQPVVDTSSGRIFAAEALARWNHPEHGLISPTRFIPLAEETGLIVALGRRILRAACCQAVAWERAGLGMIGVAVNLSARQFNSLDIVGVIEEALSDSGLSPRYLELELTESVLMPNPEQARATLMQLRAIGIQLSIDDFGTGHSSLAYLTRFPVHTLKIDRSFLQNGPEDRESASIVRAVSALGHTLGMKVIAEGVETRGQLDLVREAGCDAFQGFLVSPAVDAASFADKVTDYETNGIACWAESPDHC